MRYSWLVALGAVALASCDQDASAPRAPPAGEVVAEQAFELSCDAFAGATGESLAARFGVENMRDETLPGVEGEEYQATVIFHDNPRQRLEVIWHDPATRAQVFQVSVSGEASDWVGPAGLSLDMNLEQAQAANGGAFSVGGFNWDMGGWSGDWQGGALANQSCRVGVSWQPEGDSSGASGDQQFASDSAPMRAADPRVYMITLSYPQTQ